MRLLAKKMFDHVLESPVVYRLLQAPFAPGKFRPILEHNDVTEARRVLDIGCGPGTNARYFAHAEYLGIDLNPRYVEFARRRYRGGFLVGDATQLAIQGGFDFVLVNSVLHHLADPEVEQVLAAIPELLTPAGTVHILDLVRPPNPSPARVLAKLDRGHFARPDEAWVSLFTKHFRPKVTHRFTIGIGSMPLWRMIYLKGTRL